jgi:LmbE family N-acetylglucosaminyl deacetylase
MRAALKIGLVLLLVAAAIIVFVFRLWAGKMLYASDLVRYTSPLSAKERKEAAVPALMVVAHPDDELIFGGEMLLDPAFQWHVVVVTGASPRARFLFDQFTDLRFREFEACSHALQFEGRMWNHEDFPKHFRTMDTRRMGTQLAQLLRERPWRRIITHNAEGEYGHVQHQQVHRSVRQAWEEAAGDMPALPALEVFALDTDAPECSERKQDLCRTLYASQQGCIRSHAAWVQHGRVALA